MIQVKRLTLERNFFLLAVAIKLILFWARQSKEGISCFKVKKLVTICIYIDNILSFHFIFSDRHYINIVQNSKGTERCTLKISPFHLHLLAILSLP